MQNIQSILQVDTMQLKELINNIPGATAIYSGFNMNIVYANRAMTGFWGKDERVMGKPLIEAVPELEGQPFIGLLQGVYTSGKSVSHKEAAAVLKVNDQLQTFYFDFTYRPLANSNGEVEGIIHSATDVTELVRAKKELEKVLEQNELAKNAAGLGMFDYDLITNQLVWDAHCRQFFGLDHEGPVTYEKDFINGLYNEDRERVINVVKNAFNKTLTNGEYDIEYRTVGAVKKRVRWLRAKGKVFFDENNVAVRFIGSVLDVTAQVAARKELERAEEKLRTAIESAEMGTWFIDVNTMQLTTSPRLNELFGFNPTEKLTLEMAISHIVEQHRERVVSAINLAISTGEPYDIEYPTNSVFDGKTRWVRATGKLYKSEQGKPLHFSGTALDITERKENELRKDEFISVASHELKTPVTSLKASIQLLNRMKDDLSPLAQRLIEQSNKGMTKVSALIEDLLNVSRMNEGQLHLNKSVFTTGKLLSECCNNVRETGTHTLDIHGDMNLSVIADRHRVDQVLVNLVNNGVKYASGSQVIALEAVKEGNKVKISVTDKGPGIAADKLPYLFDRYYRADPKGNQYSGLGLGLYISAEIVKRHNGEIGVISELGKGSTFWFTLPLAGENILEARL